MSLPPLGESVSTDCPCCGLPTIVNLREVTDSPACPGCRKHGDDPDHRDRVHRELWSATAKRIAEQGAVRVRELQAQVARLDDENERLRGYIVDQYKADIFEELQEKIQSDIVTEAEIRRQSAFSREAEVMSMLILDIEPKHRGKRNKDSKCSCGLRIGDCAEWQILEPFRIQLKVWEGKQIERMLGGKHHGLPRRHPKAIKYSGDFKGLEGNIARPFFD